MLQLHKSLVKPHFEMCVVLVIPLQGGGFEEGEEDIYQGAACIRGYQLQGEANLDCFLWSVRG